LIEVTVMELGSLTQGVGDEIVGNLQLMENGRLWCHRRARVVWRGTESGLSSAEFFSEIA
jgi:hypothetical protein